MLETLDLTLVQDLAEVVRKGAKLAPSLVILEDSHLVDDLGIDSLDLVGVFLKIQDHFDVEIDDDDIAGLKTIGQVAAYVAQRKG